MQLPAVPNIVLGLLGVGLVAGGIAGLAHDRAQPPPSSASGGGSEVAIQDYNFGPKTLKVSVGDTVTWTQNDATTHTVTGRDAAVKASIASENLTQGATYQAMFDKAGTFAYYCRFHPGMAGTIEVAG